LDSGASLRAAAIRVVSVDFADSLGEVVVDSTTVKFCGQYRAARGRSLRGRRAPWITYGYSKDRRPDLKQLLFILTTSADGAVPVQFRSADGNTNDSTTHLETWESLCEVSGRTDFLYVADSKLCSIETMETIDGKGGRFVTVLPRSRQEDGHFRKWIQNHEPVWEMVWDRPNPREKYGPRDVWKVDRYPIPSQEGWPIVWVYSSLLRLHQIRSRQERLTRGVQEIERLQAQLSGPRPRVRSPFKIEEKVQEIVSRLRIRGYLRAWVSHKAEEHYRQEGPGRPGQATRYRKEKKKRLSLSYEIDDAAIEYDKKSDGMYPLLTNDRKLTPAEVLQAHKRQPQIEKRFQLAKSVHEIAPVLLKNEGRIEALFFLYFLALLVEALIERQVRLQMAKENITKLPLYPEERTCRRPTARRIFQIFSDVQGHALSEHGQVVQVFQPPLTDIQRQLLELLGVPERAYEIRA
jgi:transposase